jgi:E3 ubiquitin-protein ligase synoviolin
LGPLRPQEISILNDNLFLFLTDILLVLSVFSRDLNFRNALLFFIILGFKSLVWMINTRIDFDINEKLFTVSLLICLLSFINFILFLYLSFYNFTVLFLFAFEFSLIFLSSLKNIMMIINDREDSMEEVNNNNSINDRSLFNFYIDIGYLLILFLLYSSFIIITSLKFKVPLNVFRSSIVVLEKLITKIKLFKKYLKLCEDLENCEEGKGDPTCPICREDMDLGKKLRCKHVFHLECLKKWCERQQFCPICKVDLMLNLKEEVIYTENERIQGVAVDVVE